MEVQATTVVSFNDNNDTTDYIFKIELDETLNLDENGDVKTSFSPGDVIYLQVNKSSNVDITAVAVTDGSITSTGVGARKGETSNLFSNREVATDDEFTLDRIPTNCAVSYTGKQGAVEQSVTNIGQYKFVPDITSTPFIAKFNYSYKVNSYKYVAPTLDLEEDETYDVAIVFYITVR